MRTRTLLIVVTALALVTLTGFGYVNWDGSAAAQDEPQTWNSTMIWRPTIEEAGIALAELVNQIDASCTVDVDNVVSTNGDGPEGPIYAFAITWSC